MVILSIPGRDHENAFFRLAVDGLEKAGAQVKERSLLNVALFRYDVLNLNFPTHFVTERGIGKALGFSIGMAIYLAVARLLGRTILYTVHDVQPLNDRNRAIAGPFLRLVHALSNGFVFLSRSSWDSFRALHPTRSRKPGLLVPHGPYPTARLAEPEQLALRRSLVGDEDVFLLGYLGNIKAYKNLGALGSIPATLEDGRPIRIVVAGRADWGYEHHVETVLGMLRPGSVIRIDEHLTNAALDGLMQAVDAVVLPYLKGSNSGLAMLALSNRARIIASALPFFREMADTLGAPWVHVAGSAADLAPAVFEAASCTVAAHDRMRLEVYLEQVDFTRGTQAIYAFCDLLMRNGPTATVASGP